ncbi:uncharacterized protein LOC123396780 [Hordeum vulgare subsp. vulgare]|uniref:uncharacterized protein LOC123396780 n=1 Tax=Hordeum vulgare subsp. vulgare TaxID=112509 RepID=UPI001D1A510D|nr:uncharacterized protein LOC123396780 [Hordeum vulgare subsp. vulgare]
MQSLRPKEEDLEAFYRRFGRAPPVPLPPRPRLLIHRPLSASQEAPQLRLRRRGRQAAHDRLLPPSPQEAAARGATAVLALDGAAAAGGGGAGQGLAAEAPAQARAAQPRVRPACIGLGWRRGGAAAATAAEAQRGTGEGEHFGAPEATAPQQPAGGRLSVREEMGRVGNSGCGSPGVRRISVQGFLAPR